ncbi:MAG: MmgE/PrpD family protein [Haloarculaceae archaeon]
MVSAAGRAPPATELGAFVADLAFADVPESARRTAERAFVDTIGVTLSGAAEGAGANAMALTERESGDVALVGQSASSAFGEAVFANATAGHALDFDDTALAATDGHPSVPMVAPLLAVGAREGASGRELLTAYVAGFETQAYLDAPITPGHYEGGWHATATLGTFGATAAVAKLLDLPAETVATALNIAASLPAGLKRNFGTGTKPVHAGNAARAGVTAARLAAEGVDADPDAIGGERGFFDLYRGDGDPDRSALPTLGDQWALATDGIDVKKYACCYYTHAAIYATERLRDGAAIDPGAVERVRVTASQGAADAVVHDDPASPTQAKFSMPYLVGYALAEGTVDLAAFDPAALDDSQVQGLRERVAFAVDPDRAYDDYGVTVTIETDDGQRHERVQDHPPGTHDDPLSDAELREKFDMCAARAPTDVDAAAVYEHLDDLRTVADVGTITALL